MRIANWVWITKWNIFIHNLTRLRSERKTIVLQDLISIEDLKVERILPKIAIKTYLNNSFNHTSLVAIVTQTDHPKSIRNRCVIKIFGGVFVLPRFFLNFSFGVRAFVIGLSQISSFFSYLNNEVDVMKFSVVNNILWTLDSRQTF